MLFLPLMSTSETKPKRRDITTNALIALMALGVILCIYTPNYAVFKFWAQYSAQITIAYWILGIAFLLNRRDKLTMTAFISCAFLCIYLKSTTNPAMEAPKKTNEPTVSIAHFNLSSSNSSYTEMLQCVEKTNADIISFQEVTPDWDRVITDSLSRVYPFDKCKFIGTDIYSLKVISKYAFADCDTFFSNNLPNLKVIYKSKYTESYINIFSTYIAPPLFSSAYIQLRQQLDTLAGQILASKYPSMTVGDYNIHSSAFELQEFKRQTNLLDSRRGFRPDRNDGRISLFDVPIDHIFYTSDFNCIEFSTINGPKSERLGIKGIYQFNRDSVVAHGK